LGPEIFGWRIITEDPIDRFSVPVEEHDGRSGPDAVFFEDDAAGGFLGVNPEQDEILG
jgi:hypothetical protein